MEWLQESLNSNDADFECMPMNMDVLDPASDARKTSSSASLSSSFHSRRTADCKKWNPDMPELLGLYHAYVRGYNKDTRYAWSVFTETHKLAIPTSHQGWHKWPLKRDNLIHYNLEDIFPDLSINRILHANSDPLFLQDAQALYHHEWRLQQPQQ